MEESNNNKEEVHSEPRIEESPARKYSIPVNGQIIQEFSGDELIKNQTTGAWQTHNGMDIAANPGDEVRAMYEGTVTDVLEDPLWGVTVVIDHGEGISARYCGLNKGLNVTKDDKVSSQDVIGAVGDTMDIESSMEPHLHFEVLKNGKYINPLDFINGKCLGSGISRSKAYNGGVCCKFQYFTNCGGLKSLYPVRKSVHLDYVLSVLM